METPQGTVLIHKDRMEQLEKHKRIVIEDVRLNNRGQLRAAAGHLIRHMPGSRDCPWGWDQELWDKMIAKPLFERTVIAGALIAAEIDRMLYIQNEQPLP